MSNPMMFPQKMELRDASGSTLGFFVSVSDYERHFGNGTERSHELDVERKLWEQARKEITEERDRLRAEIAQLQDECKQYKKSLFALIPPQPFAFTEDELRDLRENGISLSQIIQEIEKEHGN